MKVLISHFFPPNSLQRLEKYLRRGLYKPHNTNIWDIICCIDKMVEYLEKFPPFGEEQRLQEDKILKMVEFSLPY